MAPSKRQIVWVTLSQARVLSPLCLVAEREVRFEVWESWMHCCCIWRWMGPWPKRKCGLGVKRDSWLGAAGQWAAQSCSVWSCVLPTSERVWKQSCWNLHGNSAQLTSWAENTHKPSWTLGLQPRKHTWVFSYTSVCVCLLQSSHETGICLGLEQIELLQPFYTHEDGSRMQRKIVVSFSWPFWAKLSILDLPMIASPVM